MTRGELMKMLEICARDYVDDAVNSINRNNHMNDIGKTYFDVPQFVVDALIVDFINFFGCYQGMDYGMTTDDLATVSDKEYDDENDEDEEEDQEQEEAPQ